MPFDYYNSVGQWQCREHPAKDRVEFKRGEKWPCCSKEMVDVKRLVSCGCVPCDHNVRECLIYPIQDDMEMPVNIADRMKIPLYARREKQNNSLRTFNKMVMIMRCDAEAYNTRNSRVDNYIIVTKFDVDIGESFY